MLFGYYFSNITKAFDDYLFIIFYFLLLLSRYRDVNTSSVNKASALGEET